MPKKKKNKKRKESIREESIKSREETKMEQMQGNLRTMKEELLMQIADGKIKADAVKLYPGGKLTFQVPGGNAVKGNLNSVRKHSKESLNEAVQNRISALEQEFQRREEFVQSVAEQEHQEAELRGESEMGGHGSSMGAQNRF